MRTWSKGFVWVNGHNLGRFWNIGPQQTMYLPGPWLKRGENEVLILDLFGPEKPLIAGLEQPILNQLRPGAGLRPRQAARGDPATRRRRAGAQRLLCSRHRYAGTQIRPPGPWTLFLPGVAQRARWEALRRRGGARTAGRFRQPAVPRRLDHRLCGQRGTRARRRQRRERHRRPDGEFLAHAMGFRRRPNIPTGSSSTWANPVPSAGSAMCPGKGARRWAGASRITASISATI